jgi:hypothetical protein
MNLSWFVSLEFVKALLMVIRAIAVFAGAGVGLVCWLLTRNADALNRHSSYH